MLLIKNAIIVDSKSKLNGKKRDILIKEGKILSIKTSIDQAKAKIWDVAGACVSIGWMDIGTQVGDPGFEHREDLSSAIEAAARGGYTAIACLPNTSPAIHSKSEVNYILKNTAKEIVDFFPIGSVSRDCKGVDITEIYDMHHAGAVAFSDGQHAIQDSGLMMRALQYVKAFDGLIVNHPTDVTIAGEGQMHEGMTSTSLGMKGIAAISEELMVQRDLYLAEYTNSRLHLLNISSGRSIDLIKEAQTNGQAVTASVPALNLVFDDEALNSFDVNYKVLPPLRTKNDIKVLRKALKSGTLSIITSNHTPLDLEAKDLEFPYADFGVIGLETTFALLNTHLVDSNFSLEELISILATNPRKMMRQDIPVIEEGSPANLTIFDPELTWVFSDQDIRSKSRNTPFVGKEFKGRVLGIVNNGDIRRI
jgi:dihydroorotase